MGLQSENLTAALKNLQKELRAMEASEKGFLARYRTARLHAFQIEFLAKFLRKSTPANLEIFESLHAITKDLEDRLGAFNEIDEMIGYCEAHKVNLSEDHSAAEYFTKKRNLAFTELRKRLTSAGWFGDQSAALEVAGLLEKLEEPDNASFKDLAAAKMAKVLRDLQNEVDDGSFNPKKNSGYTLKEVEPKVHELRREIRKIPMYASYLNGLFTLTDGYKPPSKSARHALKYFLPLAKLDFAQSDFAKLPKPRIKDPLALPRPFFLAVTKYVSELGFAKDWAQNLERLREAGMAGAIHFDQLDVALKDICGRPEPFNSIAARTIIEIEKTQVFRHMSEYLEAQR